MKVKPLEFEKSIVELEKQLEELKQLRINALLTKPYDVESLLCSIRDALSGTPSDPSVSPP